MSNEEGNKIIAEFDGWYQDLNVNKGSEINWFHKEKSTKITNELMLPRPPSGFKYHSSWDWLMPVVEKIENIKSDSQYLYSVIMGKDWAAIETNEFKPDTIVTHSEYENKILSVWYTVVKFIKWYNKKEVLTQPA